MCVYTYVYTAGTRKKKNRDKKREKERERENGLGSSSDGCTRIMQINRNPSATKRVSINFEMSPVKIQARRSPARTRES